MKLRFAALRISSIDMKMTMMLRRVSTPATPMMNKQCANNKKLGQVRVLDALPSSHPGVADSVRFLKQEDQY